MNIPSKEILEVAVKTLMNIENKLDKWQDTFDEMFDGHLVPTYCNDSIEGIIRMIELTFNDIPDEHIGSLFYWWCYEADFGRNEFADSVTDFKTGENIPMRTTDDLYNYYLKYTLDTDESNNNENK